ncbi:SMI1/KNR4 family protein [Streptomyces sp. NBC_00872]|uniref:SMI1/KNR4 family protein n=1 Tax=Streptomyces sp. NBC_00872 TaxID=2903686 RepID=UPI00386D3A89|nr:SMI1/KNR4 family protein [Streptomyces sp. NBC_00872]
MTTTPRALPVPRTLPVEPPPPAHPWRDLLQRWSDEWLDPALHEQERPEPFPPGVRAARWLGAPGATEGEISALEDRLGAELPPSYRQFLRTTNGWLNTTPEIHRLLPAREVGRLRDLDPGLIEPWTENADAFQVPDEEYYVYGDEQHSHALRPEYLPDTLKISHTPDGDVYLLNPHVVTPSGEWEAWYFAHWLPGAVRHRSFWDLMNDEYESFTHSG